MSRNEQYLSRREKANRDFANKKILSLLDHPNVRVLEPYYDSNLDDDSKEYPTIKVTVDNFDSVFIKNNSKIKIGDRNIIVIFEVDNEFKMREENHDEVLKRIEMQKNQEEMQMKEQMEQMRRQEEMQRQRYEQMQKQQREASSGEPLNRKDSVNGMGGMSGTNQSSKSDGKTGSKGLKISPEDFQKMFGNVSI